MGVYPVTQIQLDELVVHLADKLKLRGERTNHAIEVRALLRALDFVPIIKAFFGNLGLRPVDLYVILCEHITKVNQKARYAP